MMGNRGVLLLLVMLLSTRCLMVVGYEEKEAREEEEETMRHRRGSAGRPFILDKSEKVVNTEAGVLTVFWGSSGAPWGWSGGPASPMHIGIISMEPKTLFVPQYLDSSLVLFVRRGEARVGWIYKDDMVERQLKMGDVVQIESGSTFYIVNTGKGQRLHMICNIDTSESSCDGSPYQSFFIGGGRHPSSVLAGFDTATLTTAFNVTAEDVHTILESQNMGPIIYATGNVTEPRDRRRRGDKDEETEAEVQQEEEQTWTWRKLLKNILGGKADDRRKGKKGPVRSPDPYNLYDRDPDFRNDHGWSIALDEHDYSALKHSDIGVYIVNLTAGSMMAPHVNPRAMEYGVVLGGSGTIQVVFPNGTSAMNAEVSEGDVFVIPRYFPFCQIASRSGPMEFFGFTTSARRNRPQFLVGSRSILTAMMGPELAAGFGVSEERLRDVVEAQKEAIILPSWPLPEEEEAEGEWREKVKRRRGEQGGRTREKGEEVVDS